MSSFARGLFFLFVWHSLNAVGHSALVFENIATDGVAGVGFIDQNVRPAIADNGHVVFVASGSGPLGTDDLWTSDGTGMSSVDLAPNQLDQVLSVAVRSAGDIAFIARRTDALTYQGVYRTTVAGAPIATIREVGVAPGGTEGLPRPNVAMSENGTVAFSTINSSVNGGSIWRGPVDGTMTSLRQWSGTYFNTQEVDVNNAGQVAVQMEYSDPTLGLARGILIFEDPGDTLATIDTAIEKTNVGVQPMPSINSQGQVAFALNSSLTVKFYTDPNNSASPILTELNLTPGVWLSQPTAFGAPSILTQIVSTATGLNGFGDVELNDAGQIVFEANYGGESGVFLGPDPTADRVLLTGDPISPGSSNVYSIVKLGELNNNSQFTLVTSVFGGDQQVWRVTAVPEPSSVCLMATVAVACAARATWQRRLGAASAI